MTDNELMEWGCVNYTILGEPHSVNLYQELKDMAEVDGRARIKICRNAAGQVIETPVEGLDIIRERDGITIKVNPSGMYYKWDEIDGLIAALTKAKEWLK